MSKGTIELHQRCSVEQALAAFVGQPRLYCDGQYAVLDEAVLCLFTVGADRPGPHQPAPSAGIRKTAPASVAGHGDWLPEPVREVYDHSGDEVKQIRRHHVFVRAVDEEDYCYAGEAHLGSYGGSYGTDDSPPDVEADFSLQHRLPLEQWLRCGGYTGWLVTLEDAEGDHVEIGDEEAFDELLAELATREASHMSMTRYEEDSLSIYTNAACAWLMYLREPDDSGLCLDDPARGDADEHFCCDCGIDLEFPARQTVSRERAMGIARHYFRTGGLPADEDWVEC